MWCMLKEVRLQSCNHNCHLDMGMSLIIVLLILTSAMCWKMVRNLYCSFQQVIQSGSIFLYRYLTNFIGKKIQTTRVFTSSPIAHWGNKDSHFNKPAPSTQENSSPVKFPAAQQLSADPKQNKTKYLKWRISCDWWEAFFFYWDTVILKIQIMTVKLFYGIDLTIFWYLIWESFHMGIWSKVWNVYIFTFVFCFSLHFLPLF